MKANEMMIGDWVYSTFHDKPCLILGIEVYEPTNGYGRVYVTNVEEWKDINSLTGIPLTAEILEKNDFVYYKEQDIFQLYTKDIYVVEVGIYHPDFINIGYRQRTPDGMQEGIISSICKIDGGNIYVHELQHALRLCGIEKEIIV